MGRSVTYTEAQKQATVEYVDALNELHAAPKGTSYEAAVYSKASRLGASLLKLCNYNERKADQLVMVLAPTVAQIHR
jgi:tRNA 2-selenouridine synthase SelU